MDEAKAREICRAQDLSPYSRSELVQADRWVEHHALQQLDAYTRGMDKHFREWVATMARATYGSAETDTMLTKLNCYPDWAR